MLFGIIYVYSNFGIVFVFTRALGCTKIANEEYSVSDLT